MKRIVLLLCFLISSLAFSQSEEAFQRGNSLYNEGKFQEAIDTYLSIINNGEESAEVYFNLGNAYYKLSQIAPSILYYEKALKLDPGDADIKNNLQFANNSKIDVIEVLPEGIVSRTTNSLINTFTFDGWAWTSVILILLFVASVLLYFVSYTSLKKRLFFTTAILGLVLSISSVLFAYKQYNLVQNEKYAVIFSEESEVKSAPNLRSEVSFELHKGTKVKILDKVNNWNKIKLADGKIGWIPTEDLREI
ncbi:tetratricopeptide repeat protein [Aquimarina sp. ERC-38]|uniref:tetratricopeptide repeat protein n=1 Tax=Aquimarina sp. ERC-38 TaxID=2949996 RepID=UPI002246A4D1|nr:tetratricopeptide repeat protein [Aquimarina sp. ERC-38]UZO82016.1 tetratricopeptide repeat protein [Aquimarina sp. ERC-38]